MQVAEVVVVHLEAHLLMAVLQQQVVALAVRLLLAHLELLIQVAVVVAVEMLVLELQVVATAVQVSL
jgi:hypothetical protein